MDKLKRVLSGNESPDEESGIMSQLNDASTLSWSTRIKAFIGCFIIGILLSLLGSFALFFNRGLNLFAVFYTLGAAAHYIREEVVRLPIVFQSWITNFTETEFFAHFRMGRETFEAVLTEVGPLYNRRRRHHGGIPPVPTEKCFLIVLWFLGKGDTYISTADRFSVAPPTVHLIVAKMLDVINSLKTRFIMWPTKSEVTVVEKRFRDVCGFPGVLGAIDGCHIMCKVPENQQDSYQNRKCQHSIIMQGICTSDRLLTNIFVGFPGRSNDARVLQESPFFKEINEKGPIHVFPENYHIIGDKAYPLLEWLLTPYKETEKLNRAKRNYNFLLSRTRVVIEHVFGMLKGRWRILIYVNAYSIEKIVKIVGACSVLHNICLINKDYYNDEITEDDYNEDENCYNNEFSISGQEKRDLICEFLSSIV